MDLIATWGPQQTVWAPKDDETETLGTAFALALLKTSLDFFHGRTERDGTLGSQENSVDTTS